MDNGTEQRRRDLVNAAGANGQMEETEDGIRGGQGRLLTGDAIVTVGAFILFVAVLTLLVVVVASAP